MAKQLEKLVGRITAALPCAPACSVLVKLGEKCHKDNLANVSSTRYVISSHSEGERIMKTRIATAETLHYHLMGCRLKIHRLP